VTKAGSRTGRRALGRGLDALLPERDAKKSPSGPGTLPVARIDPNPDQPRKRFDAQSLDELVASLKTRGIIQPIVVRKVEGGRYQIIAGERRYRAAIQAGLSEVPVTIRQADEEEALEVSLIENVQREDLNAIDAAFAYARLVEEHGYSQEQVANALGKSRPAIANTIRLLSLPESVQKLVSEGALTEGHARAVLLADGPSRQIQVARVAVARSLSVRETEKLARTSVGSSSGKQKPQASPEIRDLQDQLQRSLGARVVLRHAKSGKGEVKIHYSSLDELDSILDRILGKKRR
jgi:ParB family chromosome partitioning protein